MDWMNPYGSFQEFSGFGTPAYKPSAVAPAAAPKKKWYEGLFSTTDANGIDPNAGAERSRTGTAIQSGAGILQGLFDDAEEEERNKQDIAYKNAQLMQAYQNNLPNMLAARQQSRQRASGLASLSGLY